MESSVKRDVYLQSVRGGVFALVFYCVGVLALALIAKLCEIDDKFLPIANQAIKVLAVLLATSLVVKDWAYLKKAWLLAVIFWLLSFGLFLAMGGTFKFGQFALDLLVAVVSASVVAIVKTKRN